MRLSLLGFALMLAACDSSAPSFSPTPARLLSATDGDTLRVVQSTLYGINDPLLFWSAPGGLNQGNHLAQVQFSSSLTFDGQGNNVSFSSTRYGDYQRVYASNVPRPFEPLEEDGTGGGVSSAPTEYFWRARVVSGNGELEGAWSEPGRFVVVADLPAPE